MLSSQSSDSRSVLKAGDTIRVESRGYQALLTLPHNGLCFLCIAAI